MCSAQQSVAKAGCPQGIARYLFQVGYPVHNANTAEKARAIWRREHPRVVLLDADSHDGWALLKAMKRDSKQLARGTSFIATAGRFEASDIATALRHGVHWHLTKPIQLPVLLLLLRRALDDEPGAACGRGVCPRSGAAGRCQRLANCLESPCARVPFLAS